MQFIITKQSYQINTPGENKENDYRTTYPDVELKSIIQDLYIIVGNNQIYLQYM